MPGTRFIRRPIMCGVPEGSLGRKSVISPSTTGNSIVSYFTVVGKVALRFKLKAAAMFKLWSKAILRTSADEPCETVKW